MERVRSNNLLAEACADQAAARPLNMKIRNAARKRALSKSSAFAPCRPSEGGPFRRRRRRGTVPR